jgi:hypothetical protein
MINKIVKLGKKETSGGRAYSIYCEIRFDGKRLSISGVEGPLKSGNCLGGCGQIDMHLKDEVENIKPAKGWNWPKLRRFFNIWENWHLNDMQAGCTHQRALNWGNDKISKPCPECGYKYGSKWLFEPVPKDVIDFLEAVPETDTEPAWV